jgi:hypothetical protein
MLQTTTPGRSNFPIPVLYTVPKIWQIFVDKEEEDPYRENFPVILGK